jgi:IS1 family transposase
MYRLDTDARARVVACLCEGTSQRATARITGINRATVARIAVDLGAACERFNDRIMRDLPCTDIQWDEVWAFVGCKQAQVRPGQRERGDCWTWIAIDRATKLIPAWYSGDRSAVSAYRFLMDLAPRLTNRVQLSTDGHTAYLQAVNAAFSNMRVDYGMLVKLYGEGRYSPGECIGARKDIIRGHPALDSICTSHAERNNLTVRMSIRRFTRLTNAFSKKLRNHRLACAVHFTHYNFCRIHQSLRVTPAMAAGLTDHVWELSEFIGLLIAAEAQLAA